MQDSQRQLKRLQDQLLASEEAAKVARDAAAAARRETASLQAGAAAAQAEAATLRQRVAASQDEVGWRLRTPAVLQCSAHPQPVTASCSTPSTIDFKQSPDNGSVLTRLVTEKLNGRRSYRHCVTQRRASAQAARAQARTLAAEGEAARMRVELAEANESLAMAKSLFARAAQANDLEEQLKARPVGTHDPLALSTALVRRCCSSSPQFMRCQPSFLVFHCSSAAWRNDQHDATRSTHVQRLPRAGVLSPVPMTLAGDSRAAADAGRRFRPC